MQINKHRFAQGHKMRGLLALFALVASAVAFVEVGKNYHDAVGIPEAAKLKAREEAAMSARNVDFRIAGGAVAPVNSHPCLVSHTV